jgi:hypothetical protein
MSSISDSQGLKDAEKALDNAHSKIEETVSRPGQTPSMTHQ